MSEVSQGEQTQAASERSDHLSVDGLPQGWRVDVSKGWRGLDMKPTWLAVLLVKDGKRWRGLSRSVCNDEGPIAAVSDLLSMLDLGTLERS